MSSKKDKFKAVLAAQQAAKRAGGAAPTQVTGGNQAAGGPPLPPPRPIPVSGAPVQVPGGNPSGNAPLPPVLTTPPSSPRDPPVQVAGGEPSVAGLPPPPGPPPGSSAMPAISPLDILRMPEPEPEPEPQLERRDRTRSSWQARKTAEVEQLRADQAFELDMDLAEWLHYIVERPDLEYSELSQMMQEPDPQVASVLAYAADIESTPTVRALLNSKGGASLGALASICKDDIGDDMISADILLEIWNGGRLDELGDLLRAGDPLPPATPPAIYARQREEQQNPQARRTHELEAAQKLNEPQPYDLHAHVAHDTDSGEEEPNFSDWARSVDALGQTLRDKLFDEGISASDFVRQCDINQDGAISATELHRKYRDIVVVDSDDPQETEISIGEARLLIQEIAADPNATTCSTEAMQDFLTQAEDPSCFWHNLALRLGREYQVAKQHENTYDSSATPSFSPPDTEAARVDHGSSRGVSSLSTSTAAALDVSAEELRRTRSAQRRIATRPSIFAFTDHILKLGRMELQHGRRNAHSGSTISYACLGWKQPVAVWCDEIEEQSWNHESGEHKTEVRYDVGFELRNDEGVLLRFRVDESLEAAPSAQDWADDLNTLGRRARRYLALEKREMDSGGHEIAEGGWALVKAAQMEQRATEYSVQWDINVESGGWKTSAETGSGARALKTSMPPFEDSLRVMNADSRVKFEKLSKELSSLRAQRKNRLTIDDPKVKMQVGMAKQGTVRGRKRRKEERLVRLLMSNFEEVISTRLQTHLEQTPHLPLEKTVKELEVTLRALAADAFPNLSTKAVGPAVRKALTEAQEAAGINDPKDAMGGLGRCRVRAIADYMPDSSLGPRYTHLIQGEELMVTDISDSQWWEGYREISEDGVLDWEEAATKAFFPRAFTEVIWCECLYRGPGKLGVTFAAAPNSRGHTCFTVHQIDQECCEAHAPKLSVGMALDTINGSPSLGMTKSQMLKAIGVRPLLLSFVRSINDLFDSTSEHSAKVLYDYDGGSIHAGLDEAYLSIKRGEVLSVLDFSDGQWWHGYSNQNPHAQGLFPASFVELITSGNQELHETQVTGAGDAGPGKPDRESVRQMLWELGVDKDTLAKVSASISVAQRKKDAVQSQPEVLEDLPPDLTPEWMGGADLAEALDLLDVDELKQMLKALNESWKGSKQDCIDRLEMYVLSRGGQQPPMLEAKLRARKAEVQELTTRDSRVLPRNHSNGMLAVREPSTKSQASTDHEVAQRQVALVKEVSDELYWILADRPPVQLYRAARRVQGAWKTHVFRQRIEESIRRYSSMQDQSKAELVRKQETQFKVILAKEQEFYEHMKLLRTAYKEPLVQYAMPDTKIRRSFFLPEDHAQIFAGIDAIESASSTMIKTLQAALRQQVEQVELIGAVRDCVPLFDSYSVFCANKSRSEHTIKKCNKASQPFRKFLRQTSARLNPAHSLGMRGLLSLDSLIEEISLHIVAFETDIHMLCHCYECPVFAEPSETFTNGCPECKHLQADNQAKGKGRPSEYDELAALVRQFDEVMLNLNSGEPSGSSDRSAGSISAGTRTTPLPGNSSGEHALGGSTSATGLPARPKMSMGSVAVRQRSMKKLADKMYFGTEHHATDSGGGHAGGRPQSWQEDSVHPLEVTGGDTKSKGKQRRKNSVVSWQTGNTGLQADGFQMDAEYDSNDDGMGDMSSSADGELRKSTKKKSTKKLFQDHVSGLN